MEPAIRDQRKRTLDAIATDYDCARPGYPAQVFGDIVALSRLPDRGGILEIGPGTGHATLPFARRGYDIDAVELGPELALLWNQNLAPYPNASIVVGPFEELDIPGDSYDLAIAASSFHWIDPDIGFAKVARSLQPDGAIALWWNRYALIDADRDFLEQTRAFYQQIAPKLISEDVDIPSADDVPHPVGALIAESGWFGKVIERRYEWSQQFDTDSFINCVSSFSRYQVMDPDIRATLLANLRALIDDKFGGSVERGMVTLLYVARRESQLKEVQ